MKPCEFKGWVELEVGDIFQKGDTWARPGTVPGDDICADYRFGMRVDADNLDDGYRLFRPVDNIIQKPKRVYQSKCKPLPLP
jgi:hypothetical protein